MAEELHEIQEHAEHARGSRKLVPVSFTMSLIAVTLAAVTVLAQRGQKEELALKADRIDQWNYYQAKDNRKMINQLFADLMDVGSFPDHAKQEKLKQKYDAAVEKYAEQQNDAQKEAKKVEQEYSVVSRRVDRLDLAEGLLDVALVITSITLLTERRVYWLIGGAFALVGVVFGISAYLL